MLYLMCNMFVLRYIDDHSVMHKCDVSCGIRQWGVGGGGRCMCLCEMKFAVTFGCQRRSSLTYSTVCMSIIV